MNCLIQLYSYDKDPVNSGDMKSWFMYYKWRVGDDDEVYFPVEETALPDIKEGDLLWFMLDGNLLGSVPVLRVTEDFNNQKRELWYNCKSIIKAPDSPPTVGAGWVIYKR